jgi:CSLREA domain-containing protein
LSSPAPVKATGPGGSTTQTFTLTVTDGTACAGISGFTSPVSPEVPEVAVGDSPVSVAIGDFNGDGIQDFAAANSNTSNVSIRLGDGAGGFTPPIAPATPEVGVGAGPFSVAIGDFNGDGIQDFATANEFSNNVSIRLGNGSGGFAPPIAPATPEVAVGSSPSSVAIGDFNGDGMQDFATANEFSHNVSIRLGNGSGGFAPPIAPATPEVTVGTFPISVAIGDFNGDGIQDFAVANEGSSNVSIRFGNGSGGFAPPIAPATPEVTVGANLFSVAIGDFNGDGIQDFAAVNNNTSNVSIRLGDGAGGFTSPIAPATPEVAVGSSPVSVAIGDFNGDGIQDFATASHNSSAVSIRLGNGSGGFTAPATPEVGVGSGPFSVAIGDFNGDGRQDFAAANEFSNNVSVRLGVCTPVVNLSVSSNSGSEATPLPAITVTARASDPVAGDQTVSLGVSGTNITGDDYILSNSTITIPSGETTGSVTFTVVDDVIFEGTETARLTISSPSSGIALGAPTTQDVTIADNETEPTLSIASTTPGAEPGTDNVFTVTLSGQTTATVTVNYATTDGSAMAGSDYTTTNGTLTFDPNVADPNTDGDANPLTQTISVPTLDDVVFEGPEDFTILLSGETNTTISGTNSATGTIADDETPPTDLVVTKTADTDDTCLPGNCSLREAIKAANFDPDPNTITFDIPVATDLGCNVGAGPCTISLTNGTELAPNSDMNINGPTAYGVVVAGSGTGRIFHITAGTVNISNLTIARGVADAGSGGGGGIRNEASLTLINVTISGNSAGGGGGIANTGTLNVTNSTISGNSAGTDGGGIANRGTLSLLNVTITNNTADQDNDGSGNGGGVFNANGSTGAFSARNSIIAGNIDIGGEAPDVARKLTSLGHNLIGDGNGSTVTAPGATGDQVGTFVSPINPRLAPLGNYGGPTQTHALLVNSPAIDAGDDCVLTVCAPEYGFSLTFDQRGTGYPRQLDGPDVDTIATVDIGSYELSSAPTGPTFEVNSTADTDDGSCDLLGTGTDCTLREAINAANASSDANTIEFEIPLADPNCNGGSGPCTISPQTNLPQIIYPVVIDGYSQTGATPNTLSGGDNANILIELKWSGIDPSVPGIGLDIIGGGSTVKGLAINGFTIEGTGAAGIRLSVAGGNFITGNFIGTDAAGNANGNLVGVLIDDVPDNIIGGTSAAFANVIANNGANGVNLLASALTGNTIRRNSIYNNGALGIDLNNDGVTPNDSGDSDPSTGTAPNNLQNFPESLTATSTGSTGTVSGTLDSGSGSFTIDFYANPVGCDPSGNGEGQTYLGSTTTIAGPFTSGTLNIASGDFITATATDANGNTSEFSACATVKANTTTTITNTADLTTSSSTGNSYVVKWTVTVDSPGTGTPTGTVTVNGGSSCSAPVADGQCYLTSTTSGLKTLVASYGGDSNFNPSDSDGALHGVNDPTCTSPPAGMVAWYPGDGNADDVKGGLNGALIGGATFAPGKVDQAFNFDGASAVVQVADNAAWNLGAGDFTIDTWINFNAISDNNVFVGQSEGAGTQNKWIFWLKSGNLEFHINGPGGSASIDVPWSPTTGRWYHVAVTRSGGNTYKFFVDGTQLGTDQVDATVIPDAAAPLTIGKAEVIPSLNGLLDEVEIFNSALSAGDIAKIYNASSAGKCRTCIPAPTGMVSWFPAEGNANDIFGTNNGTLQNGATFAPGKVGQAFSFDGVNAYVGIPNVVNSWPEGTLETWVNFKDPTPKDSGDYIFSAGNGTNLGLHKGATSPEPANDLRFGIYKTDSPGAGWQWAASSVVPNAGQWYHVAATWGPAGIKIYINGVLSGTNPYTGPSYNSTYNMIGASAIANSTVNAFVDEFEIFNRALTPEEIAALADAGNAGQCKPTPTITAAAAVARQRGSAGTISPIATVSDLDQSAGSLVVTATTVPPGITVTGITNTSGTVTATIAADCSSATIGANTVVLTVTDSNSGTSTANFTVNVTANTAPTLTYNTASVANLGSTTINPLTGPSDNGTVTAALISQGTYTGTISVDNVTGIVSISNAGPIGSHTITIQAIDNCSLPTNATFTLTVSKANQTITVGTHAPANAAFNSSFTVAATSTSGLAVSYGSSGVCTNVGATFTMTSGTGTCTVKYDQAGDGNYNAATQVTESATAQKVNQTITFGALANKTFGDPDFSVSATASSSLSVSFAATGQCTVTGATVHLTGAGSCTITASQGGDSNYNAATDVPRSFSIAKANQTITVGTHAPANAAFNSSFTVAATSGSGLAVSYSSAGACTNVGAVFTMTASTGTCTVKYDQAGNGNYNAATQVTEPVNAQKANQTITFGVLANKTFGDPDFTVSAAASSGLGVSFAATGQCTVTGATVHLTGAGSCTITASQSGNGNYNAATDVPQSFSIAAAQGGIISFSAAGVSVNEGAGSAQITVNLTNSNAAATVRYATSDTAGLQSCTVVNGKASERCDYETTVGTLRFAAGETSKSFIIPIVNDVHVEGDETFTVTLSAPTGASLGSPSTATVTILDNDFGGAVNPIDGVDFFVTQQYLDILGRLPDADGFANWVATLGPCPSNGFGEFANPGCDRVHVAAGFYQSEEFQGRGYFAYRFYEVGLDRRPLYTEFMPDMAQVGGAQSPESEVLSKATYIDEFVLRTEFKNRYDSLSNSAYVNALEQNAEITLSNKQALIDALNGGTKTRAQVLRDVVETQAVFDKFLNRGFVAMQYFGYLRRDPDTIGYQNWVNTLDADPSNFRHMTFGFIYSDEYRHRFGP